MYGISCEKFRIILPKLEASNILYSLEMRSQNLFLVGYLSVTNKFYFLTFNNVQK